jgi:hypothetical protein
MECSNNHYTSTGTGTSRHATFLRSIHRGIHGFSSERKCHQQFGRSKKCAGNHVSSQLGPSTSPSPSTGTSRHATFRRSIHGGIHGCWSKRKCRQQFGRSSKCVGNRVSSQRDSGGGEAESEI